MAHRTTEVEHHHCSETGDQRSRHVPYQQVFPALLADQSAVPKWLNENVARCDFAGCWVLVDQHRGGYLPEGGRELTGVVLLGSDTPPDCRCLMRRHQLVLPFMPYSRHKREAYDVPVAWGLWRRTGHAIPHRSRGPVFPRYPEPVYHEFLNTWAHRSSRVPVRGHANLDKPMNLMGCQCTTTSQFQGPPR